MNTLKGQNCVWGLPGRSFIKKKVKCFSLKTLKNLKIRNIDKSKEKAFKSLKDFVFQEKTQNRNQIS